MYPCATHFFIHLAVVYFPAAAGEAEPLVLLQLIPTRLFYTNPQSSGFDPQMDIDDLMNSATKYFNSLDKLPKLATCHKTILSCCK